MAKKEETKQEESTSKTEEFKVKGNEIVGKVKEIVKEGNARHVIIKNDDGKEILRFPVTLGVVGTLILPQVAALGALAAVLTSCSIVVERK